MRGTWPDFSGLTEGRARRDEGIQRTEAADTDGFDRATIDARIEELNAELYEWSANDLRRALPNVRQPLIGARIRAAARAGDIVHVGYTPSDLPSTHAHDIKTWGSA